jgi:hypothetical protein
LFQSDIGGNQAFPGYKAVIRELGHDQALRAGRVSAQ